MKSTTFNMENMDDRKYQKEIKYTNKYNVYKNADLKLESKLRLIVNKKCKCRHHNDSIKGWLDTKLERV